MDVIMQRFKAAAMSAPTITQQSSVSTTTRSTPAMFRNQAAQALVSLQ
jgi:hypothetical protein